MGRGAIAGGRLPALAALLLGACLGADPAPSDHYYRLLVPPPAPLAEAPALDGTLAVEPPTAEGLLSGRPILYVRADEPLAIHPYSYHHWSESPARLVQGALVEYLRGANLARSVTTPRMRLRPEWVLSSRILRMERVLGNSSHVFLELEFSLRAEPTDKLVWNGVYRSEVESGGDVADAVAAMNRALVEILERLARDLARS
jgi:ABC-type uncharacterized transport system auxiliary subunit